ncbi:terminase family protein [bacterium]|nr:terminase family protein [bacterium]
MNDSYLGNINVKRDGIQQQWTKEQVLEYAKCSKDPAYFARTYVKIISLDKGLVNFDLYPYQEKMFDHFNDNRFSIVLACRQSGKSISSVVYLLWYAVFHPEKTIAVLANKGATAREMLARVTLALENLPFFLQPGCRALNKGSIEFSNNSRIIAAATSGSSIRGMSVNLLFLDEFAFVERAAEFYTSTYPVISSGKDTKVIITSTANGIGNTYHKIWEGAVQKVNEYKAFTVNWWDVPGRDEEWKRQTISNTSQLQFDQEFGNCLESRSQITVLIDNIIYEIRIGDFYDCIRTRETLGLPFEEEVRLKAIRWDYHTT